ncbi:MAG: hypothetical protein K9K21_12700 [Desulfotignum sp.]|nr:hypothetical protein [Desulfotignum sp.]
MPDVYYYNYNTSHQIHCQIQCHEKIDSNRYSPRASPLKLTPDDTIETAMEALKKHPGNTWLVVFQSRGC